MCILTAEDEVARSIGHHAFLVAQDNLRDHCRISKHIFESALQIWTQEHQYVYEVFGSAAVWSAGQEDERIRLLP